jgi:DNA-binding transcriptional LysR family regulator
MQLEPIRSFVTTVEQHSVTKAAALLGLSKSTVSDHIHALERALGAQLLLTTSRRMALTPVGRAYYAECAAALAELEAAGERVKWLQQHPSGVLRVAAPVELAMHVLAPVMAEFAERHAQIRIELDLSSRNLDLRGEGFDLALRMGTITDGDLVARPLAQYSRGLYASPAYLARAGTPTAPLQLARHHCVLFSRASTPSSWQLRHGAQTVEVEIDGPLRVNSMGFVRAALLADCGIGMLPEFMVTEDVTAGRLQRVLPAWALAPAQLSAVTPSRQLAARTRAFIDFLAARLGPGSGA